MSDTLTVTSRNFFERTKTKLVASVIIGAAALMLLGFCSTAGGQSKAFQEEYDKANPSGKLDDHIAMAYQANISGYGFACFCYFICFLMLSAAAVYVSPMICGSPNEKRMVSNPTELDQASGGSYQAYSEPKAAPLASQSSNSV